MDATKNVTHTPGPWVTRRYDNGHRSVVGNVRPTSCCHVCDPAPGMHADANARLIAAAPDLLAACETMAKYGADRILCHPDARNVVARDLAILHAAIAKATGSP